jgi:hypothetical protein
MSVHKICMSVLYVCTYLCRGYTEEYECTYVSLYMYVCTYAYMYVCYGCMDICMYTLNMNIRMYVIDVCISAYLCYECNKNIVVYLPHARKVEPQNNRF